MAKDYEVMWGFQCPSLDRWISPATAYLVPRMSDDELAHYKANGYVREVILPAGIKSIQDAAEQADDRATAAQEEQRKDEAKRSAKAIERAKEEGGTGSMSKVVKGGVK
jgi:hypothetical protein